MQFFRAAGFCLTLAFLSLTLPVCAAPQIDPISAASIPAGKSLIIPITASSPNGRPLTFTATSSVNSITVTVHTNNPFWKMTVVQVAPANAPGAFQTPYRGGTVTVTNIGDLTFMLFRDLAPHTVNVMQGFSDSGFYNSNTIFHRVVPGFVIQGGDPSTNGTGAPSFRYDDEFNSAAIFSGNGQLALANSGKDTDGSQFFVTVGSQRFLDFGYTLYGQLLRGFNVLTNVINTPADGNSRPFADVIITQASFVPDNFDTVLTLTGTNKVGVAGNISVVADDGAGGRTTNTFTATTVTETQNDPPFLNPNAVTNLVAPLNKSLTNTVTTTVINSSTNYWYVSYADANSSVNGTNSTFTSTTNHLQMIAVPNSNYAGSLSFDIYVSSSSTFQTYDEQIYTFTFGDTAIAAVATNFTAQTLTLFTNQLLATFTNGVSKSSPTNFTATINWGDNILTSGVITTNLSGQKEVRGAHTYTNSGDYPVYLTIQSLPGASASVIATVSVTPTINLVRTSPNNSVSWPAWATAYQLQSATNFVNWQAVTNFSTLNGYQNVVTNQTTNTSVFFRLKK